MQRAHFESSRTLVTKLALVLAALCLIGCESRWVETRDVGALRVTEYWSRYNWDWEGGNTHVRRTTLCVRDTRRCFEDRLLYIDPDLELEPQAPRFIHVVGSEGETPPRFFDTVTGSELPCIGCGGTPGPELPPDLGQIHWSLSRDHAVCSYTDLEWKRPVFGWLGFSSSGVTLRRIDPLVEDRDRVVGPYISADGSTVAWYTCGETCILHAMVVATWSYTRDDTKCPFNDYLELAWDGNVPHPEYYWGGGLGSARDTLCRDADGNIAFPIGTPPDER